MFAAGPFDGLAWLWGKLEDLPEERRVVDEELAVDTIDSVLNLEAM